MTEVGEGQERADYQPVSQASLAALPGAFSILNSKHSSYTISLIIKNDSLNKRTHFTGVQVKIWRGSTD